MWEEIKPAVIEAGKEFFRVVVLAAIPVIIAGLEAGKIEYKNVALVVAIAVFRFVDKGLHLWGKSIEDEALTKGLTRF
jgi:hypothetical protein